MQILFAKISHHNEEEEIVVMSINCCAEGFTKETYHERVKAFAAWIKGHINRRYYVIGLQEVMPFKDRDDDISNPLQKALSTKESFCHRVRHDSLKSAALLTNLKPTDQPCIFETPSGKRVFLRSVHLPEAPYQPSQLTGGNYKNGKQISLNQSPEMIKKEVEIAAYKARGEAFEELLSRILPSAMPIIIMGDFNEPSHKDWIKSPLQKVPDGIEWPCTKILENFGFEDSAYAVQGSKSITPSISYPSTVNDSKIPFFGPAVRIDYIFVRDFKVHDYAMLDNHLSDHRFVRAIVTCP